MHLTDIAESAYTPDRRAEVCDSRTKGKRRICTMTVILLAVLVPLAFAVSWIIGLRFIHTNIAKTNLEDRARVRTTP